MSTPFVPLTAALSTNSASPAGTAPVPPRPFTPAAQQVAAQPAQGSHAGEPKITLEREGEQIKLIRVQCNCGHTVELACVY